MSIRVKSFLACILWAVIALCILLFLQRRSTTQAAHKKAEEMLPSANESAIPSLSVSQDDFEESSPQAPSQGEGLVEDNVSLDEKIASRVERFKAAKHGARVSSTALAAWAKSGGDVSIGALLLLSRDPAWADLVLEAIGTLRKHPKGAERLEEHLLDRINGEDVRLKCHAIKIYGQINPEKAVPELESVIRSNWGRPDGYGELICEAAVEGLARAGTADARALLMSQLERVSEPDWLPDYGSVVVAALVKRRENQNKSGKIKSFSPETAFAQEEKKPADALLAGNQGMSAPLLPEIREALLRYADALSLKMPPEDNPPGRQYIGEKIKEAREKARENAQSD